MTGASPVSPTEEYGAMSIGWAGRCDQLGRGVQYHGDFLDAAAYARSRRRTRMTARKSDRPPAPATMGRKEFRNDPAEAVRIAEAKGAVVITERSGKVHAVLSVPNDDRPLVD
jgi:hypothetical protein